MKGAMMKTDDLIALLSSDLAPAPKGQVVRLLALGLGANVDASAGLEFSGTSASVDVLKEVVLTTVLGGSLPVSNAVGLGHMIAWNTSAQYSVSSHRAIRFFWPGSIGGIWRSRGCRRILMSRCSMPQV